MLHISFIIFWGHRRESNPQPLASQTSALPLSYDDHIKWVYCLYTPTITTILETLPIMCGPVPPKERWKFFLFTKTSVPNKKKPQNKKTP